jgi:nucleoside-triphosphatase THEP1
LTRPGVRLASTVRVVVVTGTSDGGKTGTVIDVVEKLRAGGMGVAGFVQPGVYVEGQKTGFRLCDLSTGEEATLATLGPRAAGEFGTRFSFSEKGFRLGREALARARPGAVLIIDELGPVELRGAGHMPAVRRALAVAGLAGAVIVVRRALVPSLLAALDATDAVVIDIEIEGDRCVQTILDALALNR